MEKKKPVIIDFVGKSGAGKTFVKNQLLKHMTADRTCFDISDIKITAKDCFAFFLTAPKTCLASLALIFFNIPNSYYSMLKLLKKWFTAQIKIQKASTLNHDVVLNCEGLFIRINWIRKRTLKKVTIETMPDSIKKKFFYPDITIFVTADFDLSEHRRLQRNFAEKKNFRPKRAKKNSVFNFLKYLQQDLLAAEKSGLIKKVLYYNNDGDFDISLVEQINQLLQ